MEHLNYRVFNTTTNEEKYNFPTALPNRPATNTAGKDITVRVNQYKVTKWPEGDIFQYDVNFGHGAEKRGKIMAVWKSPQVQNQIRAATQGAAPFLWDGNKIGWCKVQMPAMTINVNLDADKPPRRVPRKPEICPVQIRVSKVIRMAVISAYLRQQMPFDNSILEAINLLDHILRQYPSEHYTSIKRSFFGHGNASRPLDECIMALKGVYSSMRLCNPMSSVDKLPSTGLAINVDVANGTFWTSQDLHQAARNFLKTRNRNKEYEKMITLLYPVKDIRTGKVTMSEDFKALRKLTKLRFKVKHRNKGDDSKVYSIKRFTFSSDPKYAQVGMNAKNTIFKWKNKNNNFAEEEISVYNYFRQTYKIQLQYWQLPLVETEKGGMFPMECCTLIPLQRYMFKMSPEQTAAMIKFAVTRPKERLESIKHGISMLDWAKDKYLQHFGIQVQDRLTETKARLLPPPEIQFGGGGKIAPGTAGRWDLRGKKFLMPNPKPLVSWGFAVLNQCVDERALRNFIKVFVQTYIGHGGIVKNTEPIIYFQQNTQSYADVLAVARRNAGEQAKAMPQIIFAVLHSRDSAMYEELKKNMDCRWAIVSQFLNQAHVLKASPQYCSNVCMKVNAKLGGTTSKVVELKGKEFFAVPTMIIGADVSHASPGSPQASMAAITVSMDMYASRYAAAVETNGVRVEMITRENFKSMLTPLFTSWCKTFNTCPLHIYYFRDGVSDGQFSHVLSQEVADMKSVLLEAYPTRAAKIAAIKWTVTVCTKRHHIRIFPKDNDPGAGDRNGNPLPGVLVENDVTHPFEYDFYLNSHAAIQGTSRPVHYQVILDEAKVPVNKFQQLVYQHSYQYMRSTTPISLFPAVYYAHLASNRARAHEAFPTSSGPRGGQKFEELQQDEAVAATGARNVAGGARTGLGSSQTGSTLKEVYPLMPMGNPENIEQAMAMRLSMWYI